VFVPSKHVERVDRSRVIRLERLTVRPLEPGAADEACLLHAGFGQRVGST
jgi:hypothetical protein